MVDGVMGTVKQFTRKILSFSLTESEPGVQIVNSASKQQTGTVNAVSKIALKCYTA